MNPSIHMFSFSTQTAAGASRRAFLIPVAAVFRSVVHPFQLNHAALLICLDEAVKRWGDSVENCICVLLKAFSIHPITYSRSKSSAVLQSVYSLGSEHGNLAAVTHRNPHRLTCLTWISTITYTTVHFFSVILSENMNWTVLNCM